MNNDAKVNNSIFRKDHPMILATNRHLATLLPVRMAYNASGWVAGTVIARNTVSGLYDTYNNSGSSGLDTAAAILFESMDSSEAAASTGQGVLRAIFGGEVFKDKLTGLDSGAITDLGGRSITDASGTNIFKF